jgi:hypothetical protein
LLIWVPGLTKSLFWMGPEMLSVFVAQSLLDYMASRHAKWGLPLDVEYDFPGLTAPENDSLAADSRLTDMACDCLIQAFRQVEAQLAESGQVLGFNSPNGVAFALGDNGKVHCVVGTVIRDSSDPDPSLIAELDSPFVDQIISASLQRSTADTVRILCYLIGVFCSKVSPFGSVQAFSSGFVRNFSKTVSVLRIVLAHHSNTQADHADSSSRDKGNQGDIHASSINTSAPS